MGLPGRRAAGAVPTPLTGSLWEDVGHGTCDRCGEYRRRYMPLMRQEIRACAPCTQVYAHSSIPVSGGLPDEEIPDEVH